MSKPYWERNGAADIWQRNGLHSDAVAYVTRVAPRADTLAAFIFKNGKQIWTESGFDTVHAAKTAATVELTKLDGVQ